MVSKIFMTVIASAQAEDGSASVRAMVRNYGQALRVRHVFSEVLVVAPRPSANGGAAPPTVVTERVPAQLRLASITWCGSQHQTLDSGNIAIVVLEGDGHGAVMSGRSLS